MVVLYEYWRSSASYRVRIALGLAGLSWRNQPVDLVAGAQHAPAHLQRNPQGLVPVLDIDGLRLTQSLAIVEYLDETRHLGLLPQDPATRARTRAVAHAIAMDIHPICNLRVAQAATATRTDLSQRDWMQMHIRPGLVAIEAMLADGKTRGHFCCGDHLTLADLCLVPQAYNARRWGVELRDLPNLSHILSHLEALPAIAAAHPDLHRPVT